MSDDRMLLPTAEAAHLLSVSVRTLFDLTSTGEIPCVRLTGPRGPKRYDPDDLRRWIERRKSSAPTADPDTPNSTATSPSPPA